MKCPHTAGVDWSVCAECVANVERLLDWSRSMALRDADINRRAKQLAQDPTDVFAVAEIVQLLELVRELARCRHERTIGITVVAMGGHALMPRCLDCGAVSDGRGVWYQPALVAKARALDDQTTSAGARARGPELDSVQKK